MNAKDALYDAVMEYCDEDKDLFGALKRDIYILTHSDNEAKKRNSMSMLLYFTLNNEKVAKAISNYMHSVSDYDIKGYENNNHISEGC